MLSPIPQKGPPGELIEASRARGCNAYHKYLLLQSSTSYENKLSFTGELMKLVSKPKKTTPPPTIYNCRLSIV